MIKSIEYKDIVITLRKMLIDNLDINEKRILNALSVRGTDLSKILNDEETYSIAMGEIFILFELYRNENEDNYTTPGENNSMDVISSYTYHIMIYGNECDKCSQIIRARFKNPQIASELRDKGIYVKKATSGEAINEFINDSLWLRIDLEIDLETRYEIENSQKEEYFSNNISLINGEIVNNS